MQTHPCLFMFKKFTFLSHTWLFYKSFYILHPIALNIISLIHHKIPDCGKGKKQRGSVRKWTTLFLPLRRNNIGKTLSQQHKRMMATASPQIFLSLFFSQANYILSTLLSVKATVSQD